MTTATTAPPDLSARRDDDVALVAAIADGDAGAMQQAYDRHAAAVMGVAMGVLRDRAHVEDVTQDVFTRLWHSPHRYRPDRGSLRTFLLMDARGRSIDLVRSARAASRRDAVDHSQRMATPGDDPEVLAVAKVASEVVREALLALPEEQRVPIGLAYFAGHSYRDVADLLVVPEGTVKSRIRAGLRRLRLTLEAERSPCTPAPC